MFASVYITVGSESEAKEIARTLLNRGLIACANMFPITSYYYWENAFQEDTEFAVIMKTQGKLLDKLISELKQLHSYEIPCIVSWDIVKGNKDYLNWIERETKGPRE